MTHKKAFVAAILAVASVPTIAQSQRISVGLERSIVGSKAGWAVGEFAAVADPSNAQRLMVCANLEDPKSGASRVGAWASFDGGNRWSYVVEDTGNTMDFEIIDPACVYGLNGQALLASLPTSFAQRPGESSAERRARTAAIDSLRLYESLDGGRTWGPRRLIGSIDREVLLVDHSRSRYRGYLYIYGNRIYDSDPWNPLWVSPDGGKTLVKESSVPDSGGMRKMPDGRERPVWSNLGFPGAVLASGTVLLPARSGTRGIDPDGKPFTFTEGMSFNGVPANRYMVETLGVLASPDGGATFRPGVAVARDINYCAGYVVAADHSEGPFRGRAYFVFGQEERVDQTPFAGLTGMDERAVCVVKLSWSDDDGKTWATPVVVSDQRIRGLRASALGLTTVHIAVNNAGVVGVHWLDRREVTPGRIEGSVRFSASLDGGQTWSPSARVSAQPLALVGRPDDAAVTAMRSARALMPIATDSAGQRARLPQPKDEIGVRLIYRAGNETFLGRNLHFAYGLVAAPDGRFHSFWTDVRSRPSGVAQLFTAPIRVSGTVAPRGRAELASLDEVTPLVQHVVFGRTEARADSVWTTMSSTMRLYNTSKDTIVGPLMLRVTRPQSRAGKAYLVGDRQELHPSSAIVDLSSRLSGNRLVPGDSLDVMVVLKVDRREGGDVGEFYVGSYQMKLYGRVGGPAGQKKGTEDTKR